MTTVRGARGARATRALVSAVATAVLVGAAATGATAVEGDGTEPLRAPTFEIRTDDGARPEDRAVLPAADRAQATAKQAIADAWLRFRTGKGSEASYRRTAERYAQVYGADLEAAAMDAAIASVSQPSGGVTTMAAAYSGRTLGTGSAGQVKSYYCGPAAAYNIASFKGKTRSAYSGVALSQASFADYNHLRTEYYGSTPWTNGTMRTGLNRWFGGSDNYRYVSQAKPTTDMVKGALTYDIDNSWPFALETYESATSTARYNGHPLGKNIGHWVTGRGYGSYGDVIYIADPSWSVWSGVNQYHNESTSTFTTKFLQVHGIVW